MVREFANFEISGLISKGGKRSRFFQVKGGGVIHKLANFETRGRDSVKT